MLPSSRRSLEDARAAIFELKDVAIPGWQEDRVRALAVERLFLIVGEALVRVRSQDPHLLDEIHDAQKIIGMRNLLAHGYDAVDLGRVEDAISLSLPILLQDLDDLLL